jgi:hypothetical protein
MIRRLFCCLGLHHRLHTIQRFGAAAHVGCPDCRREFAMHDGLRVFLPWDGDFASLYTDMGYDVEDFRRRWLDWLSGDGTGRAPSPPVTSDAVPGRPE